MLGPRAVGPKNFGGRRARVNKVVPDIIVDATSYIAVDKRHADFAARCRQHGEVTEADIDAADVLTALSLDDLMLGNFHFDAVLPVDGAYVSLLVISDDNTSPQVFETDKYAAPILS